MISLCLTLMSLLQVNTNIELCNIIYQQSAINPKIAFIVAGIESHFRQEAVSPAGAVGLFQITPIALQDVKDQLIKYRLKGSYSEKEHAFLYNCQVTSSYDMEFVSVSEIANIKVGTCFLAHLLIRFGDIDKALAFYNGGLRPVKRLEKGLKLNHETANYLVKFRKLRKEIEE